MLHPYSTLRPARAAGAPWTIDRWVGPGWRLLERHELELAVAPADGLRALSELPLRDLPAVTALFRLRGISFSPGANVGDFFSTPPFLRLDRDEGREEVFGVLTTRPPPASPEAFRRVAPTARLAAVANFRAEATPGGARLVTETWARTRGRTAALAFGAYWLAIGPWSAWIRRLILRAARARAGAARDAGRG